MKVEWKEAWEKFCLTVVRSLGPLGCRKVSSAGRSCLEFYLRGGCVRVSKVGIFTFSPLLHPTYIHTLLRFLVCIYSWVLLLLLIWE